MIMIKNENPEETFGFNLTCTYTWLVDISLHFIPIKTYLIIEFLIW